ncbi:hypothetical protein PAMC26577_10930 [Caballeronia sordidicola]|uniref:Uncharacterized protein n=1 Tax=Caballeronia sordidicola TaxID=196367 RepID=A0A242MZT3_CABSO|nr:hypothetical protein PAMC26577_10930 [Caballeronia sordidicola]
MNALGNHSGLSQQKIESFSYEKSATSVPPMFPPCLEKLQNCMTI